MFFCRGAQGGKLTLRLGPLFVFAARRSFLVDIDPRILATWEAQRTDMLP
jgi:hypothetical protein